MAADPTARDDDTDPRVRDFDAERREVLADRAVLCEHSRERNARYRGW